MNISGGILPFIIIILWLAIDKAPDDKMILSLGINQNYLLFLQSRY